MEIEIWKIASSVGGAAVLILLLTKLVGVLKKNGGSDSKTLIEQGFAALRQIADNGVRTNVLLEKIGEITTKNGDKLDKIGGSLAVAMERQIEQRKVVEEIRSKR